MITVYSMVFNEATLIGFMIDHYKLRFPNCNIVIFDNQSTDDTAKICLSKGCSVVEYDTDGKINDNRLRELKNNCWKNANTDWVCVVDCDEMIDINESQLKYEESINTSIIKFEAYDMINMYNSNDFCNIKHGIRNGLYDKSYLFNKRFIKEINYNHGAHSASPSGILRYSQQQYRAYHYKYVSEDYMLERCKYSFNRLSEENVRNNWGIQWFKQKTMEEVCLDFSDVRNRAIKII